MSTSLPRRAIENTNHWPASGIAILSLVAMCVCTGLTATAGESSEPASSIVSSSSAPNAQANWFDPAQHVGRVVYLDFWASWCAPCKRSFRWMNEIQAQYGDRGFDIIAVNLDKKREAADEFLKTAIPNFSIVFDPEGKLAKQYELQGMPTTILFDRQSRMRQTLVGYRESDRPMVHAEIEALLAEPKLEPAHAP